MRVAVIAVLAGCGGNGMSPPPDGFVDFRDTPIFTPPGYRETCDGSGVAALTGTNQFIDANDENQLLRVYVRDVDAPVQSVEISAGLGVSAADEVDLEELVRVNNRIFAISSHGRKTSGNLDRSRYKFGAFDMVSSPPNLQLAPVGVSGQLLDQMLVAANWDTPNTTVINALTAASKLGDNSDPDLAPEVNGTNIEGMAFDGTKMWIGFRNPRPNNKAIVVSVTNPDAALTGTAHFGGAAELDLGGLGVRSMVYSPSHASILILAGPHTGGLAVPFRIYKWNGDLATAPTLATTFTPPSQMSPEAIVAWPSTKEVQLVFDAGDAMIDGVPCKDLPEQQRSFIDQTLLVN